MRDFFGPAGSGWGNTGASPGMLFYLSDPQDTLPQYCCCHETGTPK